MRRDPSGATSAPAAFDPAASQVFRYLGFSFDPADHTLTCRYALDDLEFAERITFDAPAVDDPESATRAFRLVHLLAGISYYKAGCPPVVDLGEERLTPAERTLLAQFYVDGLGEMAFRNGLDLRHLRIEAKDATPAEPRPSISTTASASTGRAPLVPFGGGVDSIVSVEAVRATHPSTRLFVLNEFPAIEASIATTKLDVVRATRRIDPLLLELNKLGARNGHVPVTGILSAIAVASAVVSGADEVVMSNEWSASSGNVEWLGREVNHQWSKSWAFESAFRAVVHESLGGRVDYFSLLRPLTSLRIAKLFSAHVPYFSTFRSCNRAFHIDEHARRTEWCGECDKCCFVDLVLAPFVDAADLDAVFGGREPLRAPHLRAQFETLCAVGPERKPFECVGDERECRAAAHLAALRADRRDCALLQDLAERSRDVDPSLATHVDQLFQPIGPHHIPPHHAASVGLG